MNSSNRTNSIAHPMRFGMMVSTAVGSLLAVGCSSGETAEPQGSPPSIESVQKATVAPAKSLLAFELVRPARSGAEVNGIGTQMLSVLAGKSVQSVEVAKLPATAGSWDLAHPTASALKLSYRDSNDFFSVTNEDVTSDYAAASDIGEAGARAFLASAFRVARGLNLVSNVGLSPANAQLSHVMQGEGQMGQPVREWVSEYRFTVPRTINSIEVFDAGFEVSVHRNGKLAALKKFGPTVLSTADAAGNETPAGRGYAFEPRVSAEQIASQVKLEHPKAIVQAIGMRYWLPSGQTSGVVEPKQMYFVVPTAIIDGKEIHGRGTFVAYSLSTAGAPKTVWPQPSNNPIGDGQKH